MNEFRRPELEFYLRIAHKENVLMRRVAPAVLVLLLCPGAPMPQAQAGPFVDFFRSVKRAFNQPEQKSTHHTAHKSTNAQKSADRPDEKTAVDEPPNQHNTRTAERVAGGGNTKVDLPYGAPIPGKQGFVTSPYAPESGYIDVRGVAPGTQVKDPYTGKLFLTP
jgi:hypothetical protein